MTRNEAAAICPRLWDTPPQMLTPKECMPLIRFTASITARLTNAPHMENAIDTKLPNNIPIIKILIKFIINADTPLTEYMANTLLVWKKLMFSFDAICTGFIVSERQSSLIYEYCKEQQKSSTSIFVDPIM